MPRKHYGKTRAKRKMPYKKAKKVVQHANKVKKSKNLDTFSLTCKTNATIIPIQGVTVSNYFYTTIPLLNSAIAVGVTQNAEFNLFKNLYDQVRVNSVLVKVTPKANTLSQAEAQYDGNMNLTGDGMVHTVIDRDDAPPANITQLSRYPSYKKFNQKKSFVRKYSVKWPTGVWLDCQNIYENMSLLKQVGALGGIYLYSEDIPEDANELINEPFASIEIWYNVVFRGKTMGSLSFSGNSVTVTPSTDLPSVAPTPLYNIRGSIEDTKIVDLSNNQVTIGDTELPDEPV